MNKTVVTMNRSSASYRSFVYTRCIEKLAFKTLVSSFADKFKRIRLENTDTF